MPRVPVPVLAVLLSMLCACAARVAQNDEQQPLTAALQSKPVVLLGEVHDNAIQHALRARALQALLESGARPALLLEQFDRERQTELDRALARPGATPDDVIAAATRAGPAMQDWSWPFYKPYIALAIEYRLPIVAVNVSRNDTRRVLREGLTALGFDSNVPPDIEAAQARAIADSHCGMIDAAQAGRMAAAQVARDQFMARAIEVNASRGAVLIAGNGHVRRDVGVPRWLSPDARARSVSIGLLEADDTGNTGAASAGAASPGAASFDAAFTTPAQTRPDPCQSMRAAPKH